MSSRLMAALLVAALGLVGCNHHKQGAPDTIWTRSSVSLIPPIAVERDYDQRPFDLELALRSLAARDALLARSARPRPTAASRGARRSRIAAPVGDCSGRADLVARHFPEATRGRACRVIACESGGRADAVGPRDSRGVHPIGVFQIKGGSTDPEANVAHAAAMSKGGTDWSAWACH